MSLLPSLLPSQPALQDIETTPEQLESTPSRVTSPTETAIYICALSECHRLFPSHDRLMNHRKRDHKTESEESIVTWNESKPVS